MPTLTTTGHHTDPHRTDRAWTVQSSNREISRMNKPATPLTPQRLEHIVQLPLGTVLTDNAGVAYEFIGTRTNKVGAEFLFVRGESRLAEPEAFSLFNGALLKFPGLSAYVCKELPQ